MNFLCKIEQSICVQARNFSDLILELKKSDQLFFQNTISDIDIDYVLHNSSKHNSLHGEIIIYNIFHLNKELEKLNAEIRNKNVTETLWNEKLNSCENIKKQIDILSKNINIGTRSRAKMKMSGCSRNRRRYIKEDKFLKEKLMHKKRSDLIHRINNYLKVKEIEINKEKDEHKLHKDADIVLSDVRTKRSDTKKFLITLRELEHLRKIKEENKKIVKRACHLEAAKVFKNIIATLKVNWRKLNKEYILEEKGLKLMIKIDNDRRLCKLTKSIFDIWEVVLFNNRISLTVGQYENFEEFVILRIIWDKFIKITDGSKVPVGWILPYKSFCFFWQKHHQIKHFV